MSTLLTNSELAAQFFNVAINASINPQTLLTAKKQIADCPQSIAHAFEKQGSLKEFNIPHLWKKFYPVLEDILRNGSEAASKRAIANDIRSMTENQFRGVPGSAAAHVTPESSDPGWENGIRNIEQ